ncbi:hypothetical protein AB0K51_01910 [Kitasatospora sp. NPDC049285]|uniref:hypothetical protein n=1 Tax=Kitasatospora sp. NPDC049285 TaxID=3157096 RepID=UPI003432FF8B
MISEHSPASRAELATLLTETAKSVSAILDAEYPTPTSRSYLHPVLGALSAGPGVITELNERFETLVSRPLPATPAGLFTVASVAAALGWLTESLAELTTAVDQICTKAGISDAQPADPLSVGTEELGFPFSTTELAAIRTAAQEAGLSAGQYVELLSLALLADSRIADACTEICDGLLDDARYVRGEASDHLRTTAGSDSLPTLVRTLLARMEAGE